MVHQNRLKTSCSCLGQSSTPSTPLLKLEPEELRPILKLQAIVNKFPENDGETYHLLGKLWKSIFPEDPVPVLPCDDKWQTAGFQSRKPDGDLRTGTNPVKCLIYVARNYKEQFRQLILETMEASTSSSPLYFPLIVALIIIHSHVIHYFWLTPISSFLGYQVRGFTGRASYQLMKSLSKMLQTAEKAHIRPDAMLFESIYYVYRHSYEAWLGKYDKSSDMNLLIHFSPSIDSAMENFHNFLVSSKCENFSGVDEWMTLLKNANSNGT